MALVGRRRRAADVRVKGAPDRQVRRVGVATIDQAVSGGSNVLIAIVAARALGVEAFGLFGILFLAFVTVQGAIRSVLCEPLLVRPIDAGERPGEVIGTSLVTGVGGGVLVAAAGVATTAWEQELGLSLVILGITLPLVVLHDAGRYMGFALQRPALGLVLDLVRLCLMVTGAAAAAVTDVRALSGYVLVWTGSASLAGLVVLWQHRGAEVRFGRSWLKESWVFSWRYLLSFTFAQGAVLIATVVLAVVAGTDDLAGVRGALLLMSVAMTIQIAGGASGVPDIARAEGTQEIRGKAVRISTVVVSASLVNGAAVVAIPDAWGPVLLGATWDVASPLLVPVVLQVALQGALLGARAGLLGMREVRTTMFADVLSTPLLVGAAVAGTFLGGGIGYCWGVVVALVCVTVLWWTLLRRAILAMPDRPAGHPHPTTEGEPS